MGRNRSKARRRNKAEVLDAALAAAREGQTPNVSGSNVLGIRRVDDPYDGQARSKVVSLRHDPIGWLHAKGAVSDVQLKAGRAYQKAWNAAEIGGAKAMHIKDFVDCSRFESDTDRRMRAASDLSALHAALGKYGASLTALVLGLEIQLAEVAQMWGMTEQHAYRGLRMRLVECLDTIAVEKKLSPDRPARGPRRMRDAFDALARYANNPTLHRAVKLAQST